MNTIRLLKAEEIECRVGTISEKGLSLLLFKDARVDQKLLDETFTPMGWKRSHQVIDGNLYCTVSVWDNEKEQWVDKQDVGTMGYAEKEKSQASDSFKRACFNWGIGRELYTAPFIWIPAAMAKITKQDGRYYTSERFQVVSIGYSAEREINALAISNKSGQQVYVMTAAEPEKEKGLGKPGAKIETGISSRQMTALERELQRTGVTLEAVLGRYHIQGVEEMTPAIYTNALKGLKKSRDRQAA